MFICGFSAKDVCSILTVELCLYGLELTWEEVSVIKVLSNSQVALNLLTKSCCHLHSSYILVQRIQISISIKDITFEFVLCMKLTKLLIVWLSME